MANLAKLAIKLVADMEKAQKDFTSMSRTITSIEKSAKSATPSMKNLTDSVKGMSMMQEAAAKAQEMYKNEPLMETKRIVDEATAALGTMKSTVETMGENVAEDILHMKPTIANVQKAQGEVQKLKALHAELEKQGKGGLLAASLKQAESNMATLSNRTVQLTMDTQMFKSVLMSINAMPFMVMSVLIADVLKGMKDFMSDFNERFGGMPARIAQVTVAVGALAIGIGLAGAKMTALGVSTSYFMGLWKSSVIYQGLAGLAAMIGSCVSATTAWLVAQLKLNAALAFGLSVTGIGLILVALGAAATAVTALAMGWGKSNDAVKEAEDRMKALEMSTQKTIDRFRQLQDAARSIGGFFRTPTQDMQQQLAGLKEMRDMRNETRDQLAAKEREALEARAQRDSDKLKLVNEEIRLLRDRLRQMGNFNHAIIEEEKKMKEAIRSTYIRNEYGGLLDETRTAQQQYMNTLARVSKDLAFDQDLGKARLHDFEAEQIKKNAVAQWRATLGIEKSDAEKLSARKNELDAALQAQIINDHEYAAAKLEAEKRWCAVKQKEIADMEQAAAAQKQLAQEQGRAAAEFQNLVKQFKGMGKTPVESFKELSIDLRRVRDALAPAEFAAASEKLRADLASGLGIAQYLKDVATPSQQLAETYRNLEIYAREAGLSTKELAAAKDRARAALEKQSEYYTLYQKAQDAMLTTQQKLNRELQRIADEAKLWGWDKTVVEMMKQIKMDELLGTKPLLEENKKHTGHLDNINTTVSGKDRNAALEVGTVAYYEKKTKDTNKPLVDESKKTNIKLDELIRTTRRLHANNNRLPGVVIV